MHKFTLFSVILSLIVIVMVLELVRNDYLSGYNRADYLGFGRDYGVESADVQIDESNEVTEADLAAEGSGEEQIEPQEGESGDMENLPAELTDQDLLIVSKIVPALFEQTGFENITLEQVEFNQVIFQKLEVVASGVEQVLKFNVFQDDQFAVSIYEVLFGNSPLAEAFFADLMKQSSELSGMIVNKTDSFGKASFYINKSEGETELVLLVVQFESGVYAFEYPHATHTKLKEFIRLLGE